MTRFLLVLTALMAISCTGRPETVPVETKSVPAPLAKIVFVDQAECCNCTQARIDATWDALTSALGDPASLPVERIHNDTQPEMAAVYTTFKPIMVIPAVYFVGADNSILDMLQGELRADQLSGTIARLSGR